MLAGEVVSQVYEGNRTYDLTLKVDEESRTSAEALRNLVVDANGQKAQRWEISQRSLLPRGPTPSTARMYPASCGVGQHLPVMT